MLSVKERQRMTPNEIQALLDAKCWTRTKLAAELGVTENSVHQWFSGRRNPGGSAAVLMRMWLAELTVTSKPNGRHQPRREKQLA